MIQELDKPSRLAILKQSSPEVQELYGGKENGLAISTAAKHLGITGELAYDTFALTVGDVILGTHAKQLLGQMLKDRMELTDEQIKIAEEDLKGLLSKVPDKIAPSTPSVLPKSPEVSVMDSNAVPSTPQTTVKPIQTFAEDVELSRAHGYGAFRSTEAKPQEEPIHQSSQDDIIK